MPTSFQTDPSTLSPSERARLALGLVAWAWMAALRRGDWSSASQLLAVYQQLFNQHRQSILDGYREELRSQVAAQLPILTVDGRFGANTRKALTAGLVTGWAPDQAARQRVMAMPSSAGAVGAWFHSTLVPLAPPGRPVWDMDLVVQEITDGSLVAPTVMRTAADLVAGVGSGPAPSPSPAAPPPTTAPAVFNPASFVPDFSASSTAVVTGPTVSVTGQHGGMPAWIIGAIGLGVLAAVGVLGYTLYKRKPA